MQAHGIHSIGQVPLTPFFIMATTTPYALMVLPNLRIHAKFKDDNNTTITKQICMISEISESQLPLQAHIDYYLQKDAVICSNLPHPKHFAITDDQLQSAYNYIKKTASLVKIQQWLTSLSDITMILREIQHIFDTTLQGEQLKKTPPYIVEFVFALLRIQAIDVIIKWHNTLKYASSSRQIS